jgi:hypothetical protein
MAWDLVWRAVRTDGTALDLQVFQTLVPINDFVATCRLRS